MGRLAELTVTEPAYAVGLYGSPGNDSLDVEVVAVAIERDRAKWVEDDDTAPREAVYMSWNPLEFSRVVDDPKRYVYNRVPAKLEPAQLPFAVTPDFVTFVFDGPDHVETARNIEFSASPAAIAMLSRKGLLMT